MKFGTQTHVATRNKMPASKSTSRQNPRWQTTVTFQAGSGYILAADAAIHAKFGMWTRNGTGNGTPTSKSTSRQNPRWRTTVTFQTGSGYISATDGGIRAKFGVETPGEKWKSVVKIGFPPVFKMVDDR